MRKLWNLEGDTMEIEADTREEFVRVFARETIDRAFANLTTPEDFTEDDVVDMKVYAGEIWDAESLASTTPPAAAIPEKDTEVITVKGEGEIELSIARQKKGNTGA